MRTITKTSWLMGVSLVCAGCPSLRDVDCVGSTSEDGCDIGESPGIDGAPDREIPDGVHPDVHFWVQLGRVEQIDLLVMVDNSNSMREEQAALAANVPTIVETLTTPIDLDDDGVIDGPLAGSVHVGIISSDMGTSGFPVATCDNAERGDDGVLQNLASPAVAGCDSTYPHFLTFDVEAPDENFATDFQCVSTLGTGGCGFEQQLFAVEKALTTHAAPGAANDGFLRSSSLLAILIVTDEDDCTVSDTNIFTDDDSLGPLNLRCFNNPEMVRTVESLVEPIVALRAGGPGRLVVAGIVGVPPDLVPADVSTPNFQAILDDPRMVETVDYTPDGNGSRLTPSCDVEGTGLAFPPRRIVELIRDVDARGHTGLVQSICQTDWTPLTNAITESIAAELDSPGCTSSPLVDESGVEVAEGTPLACALYETKADGAECVGAQIDRGMSDGKRICQICQRGDGEGRPTDAYGLDVSSCPSDEGWSYDPAECASGGRIVVTAGSEPDAANAVYLECKWPVVR